MSKLLDTDYLLVNRNNQSYKIQASDFPTTGGSKPITPDANEVQFNPTVSGNGSLSNPFKLTTSICDYGKSVTSNEEVIIINQSTGSLVYFTDINSEVNGIRYDNPVGIIGANDADYTTRLLFTDTPQSIIDGTFTGLLKVAETEIYIEWTVNVEPSVEPPTLKSVQLTATGNGTNRFTNQSFKTTLDVDEGEPVSTKSIAYKVEGNLFTQAESDEITGASVVATPGGWTDKGKSSAINLENINENHVLISDGNIMAGFGVNPSGSKTQLIYTISNTSTGSWTRRNTGSMTKITCMFYGNGVWIAAGDSVGDLYALRSTNGTSWSECYKFDFQQNSTIRSGCYAEGNGSLSYVMFGSTKANETNYDNWVITSQDGLNWTKRVTNLNYAPKNVAYSPTSGNWVAVNSDGIWYSSNAVTWIPGNVPANANSFRRVVWGDNKFVSIGYDQNVKSFCLTSDNGINWENITGNMFEGPWNSFLMYANNRYYIPALNTCAWSTDALDWKVSESAIAGHSSTIGWDPKQQLWVGVGDGTINGVDNPGWSTSEFGIDSTSSFELELASEKELADFNVDDPVVQNDGNAAGIISEITPNGTSSTITLTNEQGTWLENSGTTVLGPPKQGNTASTAYLELNNSRQVINLSKNPVFHISTDPEDNISFDVPPPTGQTWDFELPDGTTIQSQAFVDNSSAGLGGERSPATGTIDSNIIQPGGNPFSYRSLTEEELNRSIVLFESRELRTEKYRQDLVTREALLRSNLEDQGFSSTLITDVLNAY